MSSYETAGDVAACAAVLGHPFRDPGLLTLALTHASASKTRPESNERLEFLGDAILGAVVCDLLFEKYPEASEGELTRIKSFVVSRHVCGKLADELGLERFVVIGRGLSGYSAVPVSILSAVFESVVAAIYLDGGWEPVAKFIRSRIEPHIEHTAIAEYGRNFKSILQQYAQKTLGQTPVYDLLDEKGPDHSKHFMVRASLAGQEYAAAWGPNKKEAEQRAASNALAALEGLPPPYDGSSHAFDALLPASADVFAKTGLPLADGNGVISMTDGALERREIPPALPPNVPVPRDTVDVPNSEDRDPFAEGIL